MIKIKDKTFVPYISAHALKKRIAEMGAEISKKYEGQTPVLIGVLNGCFVFMSDLAKHINIPVEVSFIKISSYSGTASTGTVNSLIGLEISLKDREVIIIEDIIDTGLSMKHLLGQVQAQQPKKLEVAALLVKPDAIQHEIEIQYKGFEIPNKFVVGYGMDYDGLGRNLPALYQLK